ncbi:MAG: hypothetical protein U5N27_24325 [Rhizobium sp.]|nr:hypothetical protein [Rhizobium sp.]
MPLGHLVERDHCRIKRRPRLLRQDADLAAPKRAEEFRLGKRERLPLDRDRSGGRQPFRGRMPMIAWASRLLPRAGFAKDGEGAPGFQGERDRSDDLAGRGRNRGCFDG